jgi:leader peptidase (prepilin peptidase)/N-methyltransferase
VGDEEAELGVSLIPGRDVFRPHLHRWSGGVTHASAGRRSATVGVALFALAALVLAALAGTAPIAALIAVALMVPAAVIDIEQRRLPDGWSIASLIALVVALSVGAAFGQPIAAGTTMSTTIGGLVGGALAMALPVLALHLVSPDAMGFGDVKAAVALGAAVGTIDWRLAAVALCLAALTGGVVGVLGRRRTIPFGPFLVFGAWAAVLANQPLIDTLFSGASMP